MKSQFAAQSSFSSEKILGLLTACFYVFFTLVPDSHSVMVMYPFVSLWQMGLLFPVIWLLLLLWSGKIYSLGNGLDWLMGLIIIGVAVSTFFAQFPNQAIWYGWVVICFVASVYLLNSYLRTSQSRDKFLNFQGYLSLAFVVISLFLWIEDTLLPELERIAQLKVQGVNLSFSFSVVELRNWAPLGHQNYVAGYLLLCLPLFIGLSIIAKGWRRWLWLGACVLGLLDLYTTSSKGGFLGLVITLIISIIFLLIFSSLPRLWLFLGAISSLLIVLLLIISNNRFLSIITRIFQGQGSRELVYRTINAVVGYRMGMSAPLTGVGLGGVPLLYQKYHPVWAGGESELAFQLHSTPVQLWAEMGIWSVIYAISIIILVSAIALKLLRKHNSITGSDRIFAWSILVIILVIITLLTVIIVNNANKYRDFSEYNNERYKISLKYPKDWSIEELEDPITGEIAVLLAPAEDGFDLFQEKIYISVDELPAEINSLDLYSQIMLKKIQSQLAPNTIIYEGDIDNLDGNKARSLTYLRQEGTKSLQQMEIFTVKENRAYLFTYIAEDIKYQEFLKITKKILGSLEIMGIEKREQGTDNRE